MKDAAHPVWTILKVVAILATATLFSYTNANSFDDTEIKMLTELAVVLFGGTAVESLLKARKHGL